MVTVLRTPARPNLSSTSHVSHGVTYEEPDCAFCEGRVRRTAIEYGLIAAGISLAIIAVVNGLGSNLNTKFASINSSLK